jgi:hypothetical protein
LQLRRRFPASSEVSHASVHSWPGKSRAPDSRGGGRGLRVQQQLDFDADDAVDPVIVAFVPVILTLVVPFDAVLAAIRICRGIRPAVGPIGWSAQHLRVTVIVFVAVRRHAVHER